MDSFKMLVFDGCGGCQLGIIGVDMDFARIFDAFLCMGKSEKDGVAKIGIVIGRFDRKNLTEALKTCDNLIICGECANRSLNMMGLDADLSDRVFCAVGCPVSPEEFVLILQSIAKGFRYKPKSYPLCFECKALENECLLKRGQKCYGPITYAGCNARCPSMGVACRGCRGTIEDAKMELLEGIWKEKFTA